MKSGLEEARQLMVTCTGYFFLYFYSWYIKQENLRKYIWMWNQSFSFSLQETCSGQIHLALRRLQSNLGNGILPDAVQNFTEICTQCIAIHLKVETNTFHWNLQHFHFLETLSLSHKLDRFLAFQIFSICFSLLARILQIALAHKWLFIIYILPQVSLWEAVKKMFFRNNS